MAHGGRVSRILAIDPGNEESAWAYLDNGKLDGAGKAANASVLEMLSEHDPELYDVLAVEMIASYGMAVGREVFDTCVWIGRFVEAWHRHGGTFRLVYRKDVKLFHCQTIRANDANIRAALIDRFGPGKERAIGTKKAPGPLYGIKGDEWSALAVALTADEAVAAVLGEKVMA
jgi:hypothetical protein